MYQIGLGMRFCFFSIPGKYWHWVLIKKFHTSLVWVFRSKADLCLVYGKYIQVSYQSDIGIRMLLLHVIPG
jgi:hypothetical protein